MLGLKSGINSINNAGTSTHELFADVSTRKLESISVGEGSGKISKGTGNAFVGFESGKHNIEGSFGVFVGYHAGSFNQHGNWNTYVGAYSGEKNNRGANNTFIGFKAGQLNADGSDSTAIGVNAMRESSVGNRNVAVGFSAGERLLEGDNNTMIGSEAGQNIRSGNLNTMAGYRSGRGSFRGNQNTYFGAYSGYSNSEGDANSLIGYGAGEFLVNGNLNVAVGAYSLQNLSNGDSNTSIGAFAGANVSGTGNVILGTSAGSSNTLGDNNTIIGKNAAYNTVGDRNVVIGAAETANTNLSTDYSNSVIIGYKSSNSLFKSGSNNIFIGSGADATSDSVSNAISIGSALTFVSSDSISIGKEVQNIGTNSVLLGNDIYSDSKNCVSLGHKIRIDNVNIFYDPLNTSFPPSSAFGLISNYTQTLEIGRLLNSNVAAATTVYSETDYDSVNNLLSGFSVNKNIDFFGSNYVHIEIRPITIEQISITNINTSITEYIDANDLVVSSLPDSNLYIDPNNDTDFNSNITKNNYAVTVSPINIGTTTPVLYNLIPSSNFSNILNIHVARRLNIEYYDSNGSIVEENDFMDIPSSSTSTREVKDYVYKNPTYGYLIGNTYTQHIESLYAKEDRYSLVRVNTFTIDSSTYNIIPEEKLIKYTEVPLLINNTYVPLLPNYDKTYVTSNIYLHQTDNTVIDKSYLNVITESTNAISITIKSIHSNLILTYNDTEYDSTTISSLPENIPYTDFTFLIKIKDNAVNSTNLEINVSVKYENESTSSEYTFNCIHTPIMDFIESFNTDIYIEQFSIEPVNISRRNGIIIRSHPQYGTAEIVSQDEGFPIFTYTPRIFNFGKDVFTISVTDFNIFYGISYNRLVTVNIYTKSTTTKFTLTKLQEPTISTTSEPTSFNTSGTNNIYNDLYGRFLYSDRPIDTGIVYEKTVTHTIPTVQLQDTTVYNYDGVYTRSTNDINNDRNIVIIKEGIGIVNSFTQQDISEKKIHIYNSFPFFSQSGVGRIFFENSIEIEINYIYSTTVDVLVETLDFNTIQQSNTTWTNINHTRNVAFNDGKLLLIDPASEEEAYFEYVDIRTKIILHKITIDKKQILINNKVYLNEGFEPEKRYLTPFDLLFVKDSILPQNIIFDFSNSPNITFIKTDISLEVTSFTQKDINDKLIYIETNAINPVTDEIDINGEIKIGTTFTLGITFIINRYLHNQFKQYLDSPSSNVLFQFNETYSHELVGGLWEYINNDDVYVHITKPPIHGFLYVEEEESGSYSITNRISFKTLRDATTRVRYIPYVPMDMQNDTYECVFEYKGRSSPKYTILIKNYWSKWGILEISNTDTVVTHINNTYRSKGMIDDTIFWKEDSVSSVKLVKYSDPNANPPIELVVYSYTEGFAIKLDNIIQRKVFSKTSLNLNLLTEIYGNIYFNDLFSTLDKYNVGENVIFFIITPPMDGAILRELTTSEFEAVSHFNTEDIINNKVFYQHFGKSDLNDIIEIKVGTNNYDLSDNKCTINISVIEPIVVTTNLYDYIYHDTIAEGRSKYNLIDTKHLDVSPGGVIHLYDSSNNIDLFIKEGDEYIPTTSFKKEDLANNGVFYKPSQSFFDNNGGSNPNLPLSFAFTTTNSLVANKLSTFAVYDSFFVNKWYAKYNTFESINTLISEITIDEVQIISYEAQRALNLGEKKTTFEFEYLPLRDIFPSPKLDEIINISNYTYTFELVSTSDDVFFAMEFTTYAIHVKYNYENEKPQDTYQLVLATSVFEFNTWKTVSLVVNDNLNNGKLSIYINNQNYTSFSDVDPQNQLPTISDHDLDSLHVIRISVPVNNNSFTGTATATIGDIKDTNFYYDLQNYSKSLFFRNFKILSQAPDEISSYNIVIGDQLDIKGYKNICIGQNFATSGQGSIIIGNDIGREELTIEDTIAQQSVNEIINSIVISTDSFKNTKVRDIIAIGNDILNNANAEDTIAIDEFLSKKPVLIGNNIDTSKLDYHVNFENTFLKTTIGFPQIYCGLSGEAVCIGYSSNMKYNSELNKLYVNNNAIISGNIGIGTDNPQHSLDVNGTMLVKSNATFATDSIVSLPPFSNVTFGGILLSTLVATRKTSIIATSPSLHSLRIDFSPPEINEAYQVIVTGSISNTGNTLSVGASKTISSITIQARDTSGTLQRFQVDGVNEITEFTLDIVMMRDGIIIDSFSWNRNTLDKDIREDA